MAKKNILKRLKKLSKRIYILRYSPWSIKNMRKYERYYSYIRKKSAPPESLIFVQYFIQTILGIYKTDYGSVKADFLLTGNDDLVSLISCIKLLQNGHSVIFLPYELEGYTQHIKPWYRARKQTIPEESINLLIAQLNEEIKHQMTYEEVLNCLVSQINNSEFSENFILLSTSTLSDPQETPSGFIALAKHEKKVSIGSPLKRLNQCLILDSLTKGEDSTYNRRKGRLISMVEFNRIVFTSSKTYFSPRIKSNNEIKIGDAERETKDIDDLRYSHRNHDILQALSINEFIEVKK